ncbi:hypothetical protein ACFCXH_11965 [Streptomyces nojiriensis]|uniref:hypothetical protein n=1 Tax=Streptomyces nojiriensis TaxID=66374 RepID=UPI0035DBEC5B
MAQVTRVPQAADHGWWASAPGAEAVFAGQLLIGLALFVVLPEPEAGPAGRRPELHPVGNTDPGSMRPLWRSGPPDVLLAP